MRTAAGETWEDQTLGEWDQGWAKLRLRGLGQDYGEWDQGLVKGLGQAY